MTFSHIRTRLWSSMSTTGPPDKVGVYNGKGPKWVTKRCTHTHMQHPKLPSVFFFWSPLLFTYIGSMALSRFHGNMLWIDGISVSFLM